MAAQADAAAAQAPARLFAAGQTEQGIPEADVQAADAFFQAASSHECLTNIASTQWHQLQKIRQIEKQAPFMERRQDAQCSLPAEAPQTVPDAARETDRASRSNRDRHGEERQRQREGERD